VRTRLGGEHKHAAAAANILSAQSGTMEWTMTRSLALSHTAAYTHPPLHQQTALVSELLTFEVVVGVVRQDLLPLACQVIECILVPDLFISFNDSYPLIYKGYRLFSEQHDACKHTAQMHHTTLEYSVAATSIWQEQFWCLLRLTTPLKSLQ